MISTDKKIECILYAVSFKQKYRLNIEESIQRAYEELYHIWKQDMNEREKRHNRDV